MNTFCGKSSEKCSGVRPAAPRPIAIGSYGQAQPVFVTDTCVYAETPKAAPYASR
ncbi:MAG: hypothetical protein NC184_03005 [Roseburia sp.]|nr:hypothetical protein [Roseburia sp.]